MMLVLGIVEAAKRLGVNGNKSFVLAIGLGFFFGALEYGIGHGLIPAVVVPYVEWFVYSVSYALAATGFFDLGKKFLGAK